MKRKLFLSVIIGVLLLTGTVAVTAHQQPPVNTPTQIAAPNADIQLLQQQITAKTLMPDQVIPGKNIFGLRRAGPTGPGFPHGDVVVTDMKGNILASLSSPGNNRVKDPEMLNSTTAFLRDNNPFFWNLETNVTQYFPFRGGGHDMEYNPMTKTFLLFRNNNLGNYSGQAASYQDVYEVDAQGNTVRFFNSTTNFPYNASIADGESQRGNIGWLHANSLFWDFENDAVYYSARGIDTFYKIQWSTGKVLWGLGVHGNFTMYDINGKQRDSIFYHQHSVEKIGPNRFILFDNDYLNTSSSNPQIGTPKMTEIVINETTMEAHVVWQYTAPSTYFGAPWGDANRLPGGNTLGTFGYITHDVHMTEVNPAGQKVWEQNITQLDNYQWGQYRGERFYDAPVIQANASVNADGQTILHVSAWDAVKLRYHRPGTLKVTYGDQVKTEDFSFLPDFQGNHFDINLGSVSTPLNVNITVSNADGKVGVLAKQITTGSSNNQSSSSGTPFPMTPMVLLAIPVILIRKRKSLA